LNLEFLTLLALLCGTVLAADWLASRTVLRHAGTALLAIALGALLSNLRVIPTGTDPDSQVPLYDFIFTYLAPLSIFWLLLRANLKQLLQAGLPMLALFGMGAFGTVLGTVIALGAFHSAGAFAEWNTAIGGALVGTYTGGSLNFNAIALHYGLVREGVLYGGIIAADNIITGVWMAATLAAPRLLAPLWRRNAQRQPEPAATPGAPITDGDHEPISARSLTVIAALGITALLITEVLQIYLRQWEIRVPGILLLSALALALAQIPAVNRLPGTQMLGMVAVYFFLTVIGAHCDLSALHTLGSTGLLVLALTTSIVLIHGTTVFTFARLLHMDLTSAAIASQANIGGAATALAIAKAHDRSDLAAPAVLVGTLGTASGTFLGLFAAETLLPLLLP